MEFSPNFSSFFTARPTSERYNDPLKVIPEGSMVEYLPVGPKGAPKTIFGKKYFRPEIPNPLSQPSVHGRVTRCCWHCIVKKKLHQYSFIYTLRVG